MYSFLREHTRMADHVINMTEEPIRLYDDSTGDIVTFFPNIRRFCRDKLAKLFPVDAYYVFTADMVDEIRWFQEYCGNVAIIGRIDCGRGGVKMVSLTSANYVDIIRFRKGGS